MCPACYTALLWMVAGVATTSVSGTTAFIMARQLRRDARLERANKETNHEQTNDSASAHCLEG